ncbi:MAG: bifunctional DNA primase/polymerase [Deltaproteobacteria bacterium]|jgi:hypothetical protein|nr:bifunctional DNA primase/polymerase [Deltaproteobacteria bacterium]
MVLSLLDAALALVEAGRSVIPIRDKKPLVKWKQYQGRLPSPEEIRNWFLRLPVEKIAVITGEISGRIWVADCDGPEAVAWAEMNLPWTPVKAVSRRGKHYYYLMPEGRSIRNGVNVRAEAYVQGSSQIDVRGEGGYVVVPPSPHSDGRYLWEVCGTWEEIPEYVFPSAMNALEPAGEGELLAEEPSQGELTYAPVSEGERNSRLARLVGHWIRKGNSCEELLYLAESWNRRNSPPLPDSAVVSTVKSIVRSHERNYGVEVQKDLSVVTLFSEEPRETDAVPERLVTPGGLLQEIVGFVDRSSPVSFPLFSVAAGLCLLGTLVGQKIMTESLLKTNLYMIALAPSGTGKDSPLSAIETLMTETRSAEEFLGTDQLASAPALWKRLYQNPCQLFMFDELGDLMGGMTSDKKNSYKAELAKALKILFTKKGKSSKAYADTGNDFVVHWHHVSLYGTGVPTVFWKSLSAEDVRGGFLGRAVIFDCDIPVVRVKKELDLAIPAGLAAAVSGLAAFERKFDGNLKKTPRPLKVRKDRSASAFMDDFEDKYVRLANEHKNDRDGVDVIYTRVSENVHKIALIHAVSRTGTIPNAVTLPDVTFAAELLDWSVPRTVRKIRDNISFNPQDAFRRRVLKDGRERGYLTAKEIYRLAQDCTAKQVEDALRLMETAQEIEKGSRGAGTKIQRIYYVNG